MGVGVGFRGHFGYGEESTYGTAVARSHFTEINSESVQLEEARIESESLYRRGIINTRVSQGAKTVNGDVEFEAGYGGWLKLAKHAFGRVDTSTPDPTSASTVKRHKFTIQDTLPTGLTVELYRDTGDFVTGPNEAHLYSGCKISSMSFDCAVDEILKVGVSFIGRDENRGAKSTPNFSTERLAVYHQGKLVWGSDELPVENFNVSLNNNLEYRPKLNSRVTREPLPSGKVEVTGSFTTEFDNEAQYDDFRNATERALVITFTGLNISGSFDRYIKLTCNVVILSSVRMMLNNVGRIMAEIDFKAYRSLTLNELELEVQNTETGI